MSFLLNNWQFIAVAVFIFTSFYNRKLLRVDFLEVAKFSAFLLILFAFRFSMFLDHATYAKLQSPSEYLSILLVPLEDCFFVLMPYLVMEFTKKYDSFLSRVLKVLFWVLLCLFFASGHLYTKSTIWIIFTFFAPIISLYFAKKYGFGTTMLCHFLYDFTTVFMFDLVVVFNVIHKIGFLLRGF